MGLPEEDVSRPPPFLHQHHIDSVVTASSGSASALSMDLEVMQSENAQQSSQSQGDYLHYIDYSDSGSEYETQSVHPADDDSESDHNESYQGSTRGVNLMKQHQDSELDYQEIDYGGEC
ncbi:hypothetical protein ABBQ38_006328 [Trebouxia sp. C0009 RCD-2024]